MINESGQLNISSQLKENFTFTIKNIEWKKPKYIISGSKDNKQYIVNLAETDVISILQKNGVDANQILKTKTNSTGLAKLAYEKLHNQEWVFQVKNYTELKTTQKFSTGDYISGGPTKTKEIDLSDPWDRVMDPIPFRPVKVPYYGPNPRLGFANLPVPITSVQYNKQSDYDEIPILRSEGTVKKGTGYSYESYNFTWVVDGAWEIQKGLIDVINLINLCPFISAEGRPFASLNDGHIAIQAEKSEIPYTSLAIKNYSVSTSPGMPNQLIVQLSAEPFNYQYYVPSYQNPNPKGWYNKYPRIDYDDMICWPLVKLWATSRNKFTLGDKFDGGLKLFFLTNKGNDALTDIVNEDINKTQGSLDDSAFGGLQGLIAKDSTKVLSNNVAEILSTDNTQRMFTIKINNKRSWDELFITSRPQIKGLVDWAKLETKSYAFAGNNNTINYSAFTNNSPANTNTFSKPNISGASISIVDVDVEGDLTTNITSYIKNKYGIIGTPIAGSPTYELWINTVQPLIENATANPYTYFALLLVTRHKDDELKLATNAKSIQKKLTKQLANSTFSGRVRTEVLTNNDNKEIIFDSIKETGENIIIESFTGSKGFTLGLKTLQIDTLPLHEYIGGNDTVITIQGKCFGLASLNKVKKIKDDYDSRAVTKTAEKFSTDASTFARFSSFMGVDNELFRILGVDFIIPLDVKILDVDGEPETWSWTLTCLQHSLQALQQEKVRFFDTESSNLGRILNYDANGQDRSTPNPTVAHAIEYISMLDRLSKEEVYPDMQLPTYAELYSWISSLKKIATAWDYVAKNSTKTTNPVLSLDYVRSQSTALNKINLTDFDWSIADTCREFFEYDYKTFLEWDEPLFSANKNPEQFVDPDFFCYYEDHDDWKKLIDELAEREHGPRVGLESKARNETLPKEPQRFIDKGHADIVTVFPPDSQTNNMENLNTIYKTVRDSYMYPKAKASVVKAKYDEANAKFDKAAGEKSWWGTNSSYVEATKVGKTEIKSIKSTEQDIAKFLGDNPSNLQQPAPAADADPNKQGLTSFGNPKEVIKFDKEFLKQLNNVKIRLELLKYYQQKGRALITPFKIQLAGGLGTIGASINASTPNTDRLWAPATINIEAEWERLLKDHHYLSFDNTRPFNLRDYREFLDLIANGKDGNYGLNNPSVNWGFLNTIKINSNYAAIARGSVRIDFEVNPSRGDINYRLTSFEDIFAYYGNKLNIDPTVIKAVLLRREGVGSHLTNSIPQELFTRFNLNPNKYADRIQLVSSLYAQGITYYKLPSLALIYVEAYLSAPLAKKYVDSQGNFSNDLHVRLTALRDKYASNKYGSNIIALGKELKTFGDLSAPLNEYWNAYIQISRVFGSYGDSFPVDGYFNNFSPLIPVDADDNQDINFDLPGPSGTTTNIDLGRTSIDLLSYDNQTFRNLNTDNLATTFSKATKFKSAQEPKSEAAIYGFISDMRNYGVYGRLLGAFPTVQATIINEGFFYVNGSQKLWDQYYTRSGIVDVEIFKSRLIAADTCSITYSNMFHYLSAYALEEAHSESLARAARNRYTTNLTTTTGIWRSIADIFNNAVLKNIPEDLIQLWQNNRLKQLALHPGARLQVRLGYGSLASSLPVVFNGTVVSCPLQDGYMTLTAVGDGLELERQISRSLVPVDNGFNYQDSGAFGIGKDPSSIITESLVGGSIIANLTGGRFGKDDNGIAHFGNIVYGDKGAHRPYETQINIYTSSPTRIQQGLTYVNNYFNVNALYNFSDVNLFSVSIKEPTVWKVANVCANACLDFVTRAETFSSRSTLFFGKWWYPYNYDYHPSIINLLIDKPTDTNTTQPNAVQVKPNNKDIGYGYQDQISTAPFTPGINPNQNSAQGTYSSPDEYEAALERARAETDINIESNGDIKAVKQNKQFNKKLDTPGQSVSKVPDSAYQPSPQTVESTQFTQQLDLIKDVDTMTQYCKSKNYMQAYIISSHMNLLENRMSLESEKFATDAVGVHLENGILKADGINKTITYHMDNNIISADRKTATVDTGILLTNAQKGIDGVLAKAATSISWIPALNDFIKESPSTPAINNAVISAMTKMARDMYDGEIITLLQPTMKPGDLIQFTDIKSSLKGPLFVKAVVHKLNVKSGSLTVVIPDLVALPASSMVGLHTISNLSMGILQKASNYTAYKATNILWRLMVNNSNKRFAANLAKDTYSYNLLEDHFNDGFERLSDVDFNQTKNLLKTHIDTEIGKLEKQAEKLTGTAKQEALQKIATVKKDLSLKNLSKSGISQISQKLEALGLKPFNDFVLSEGTEGLTADMFKFRKDLSIFVKDNMKIIQEGGVPVQLVGRSKKDLIVSLEQIVNKKKAAFFLEMKTKHWDKVPLHIKTEIETMQSTLNWFDKLFRPGKAFEGTKFGGKFSTTQYLSNQQNLLFGTNNGSSNIMKNAEAFAEFPEAHVDEYIKAQQALGDLDKVMDDLDKQGLSDLVGQLHNSFDAETKAKILKWFEENSETKALKLAKKAANSLPGKVVTKTINTDKLLTKAVSFYNIEKKLKEVTQTAKTVRLLSNCGPQIVFNIAKEVVMMSIGNQLVLGVNARLASLHSVMLIPLMSTRSRLPYVAGIRGHQGAVIGDTPGWADNLLTGLLTGKDGGIGTTTSFISAFLGVEAPEWATMNRQDQELMMNLYGDVYGNQYQQNHISTTGDH